MLISIVYKQKTTGTSAEVFNRERGLNEVPKHQILQRTMPIISMEKCTDLRQAVFKLLLT